MRRVSRGEVHLSNSRMPKMLASKLLPASLMSLMAKAFLFLVAAVAPWYLSLQANGCEVKYHVSLSYSTISIAPVLLRNRSCWQCWCPLWDWQEAEMIRLIVPLIQRTTVSLVRLRKNRTRLMKCKSISNSFSCKLLYMCCVRLFSQQ